MEYYRFFISVSSKNLQLLLLPGVLYFSYQQTQIITITERNGSVYKKWNRNGRLVCIQTSLFGMFAKFPVQNLFSNDKCFV